MNRKDREVLCREEIVDILNRCDTVSIGIQGTEYPYVVPVSFGVAEEGDSLQIYFHGAQRGLKTELMRQHPRVCLEGHIFRQVEKTQHGITTRYESVVGFGRVEQVEGEEILTGLRWILQHYQIKDYPLDRCRGLSATAVYKIRIESITGKKNLSE